MRVILDKSRQAENAPYAKDLVDAGVLVLTDAKHPIAHHQVLVIDNTTVITGSFDFTKAAEEENAENLLVIRDPAIVTKYAGKWDVHVEHSEQHREK